MKVTISHELCRTQNYLSIIDCPLAVTLTRLGFSNVRVSSDRVYVNGKGYRFEDITDNPHGWNSRTQRECAMTKTDFVLDIPGLELPEKAGESHGS